MATNVIIADDHSIVREGIKTVLENSGELIRVIGEAENGRDLLTLVEQRHADICIIDISMPYLNGIETAKRLKKIAPRCKIIVLSMHDDRSSVEKALKAGVNGYLIKESAVDEIVQAIKEVQMDRYYLTPRISKYLVEDYVGNNVSDSRKKTVELTPKEKEILQLLAEGLTSKEIGLQLGMSFNTVNVHKNHIMQKLGFHKLAELIRYAIKEGISQL